MTLYKEYIQAQTIQDALDGLITVEGTTAVISGGTDLLLDIRQGRHKPVDRMVDVSAVSEMREIRQEGDWIYLGASATHKEIITHPLLLEHAQCVVEGCGLIGGPQVRNVATIGGNVAHALPAGDGTVSLLALGTEVQLASREGTEFLPLLEIFAGPGKVKFSRKDKLVVGFRFKKKEPGEASAFHRVMRPQGVAIAILNMAASVLVKDQKIKDLKLSCGPAGPKPFRGFKTEDFIRGKSLDDAFWAEASQILAEEVSLRTSANRATKEYRHHLLPFLLQTVLEKAISRAIDQSYKLKAE